MNEYALLLWAMTAARHQWPMPPAKQPVAVIQQHKEPEHRLSDREREELRLAIDRIAARATGRVVYDPAIGFYVPELKPEERSK